ncbi:hypothetical protein H0H93_014224 [Arthromyces matolae]|nr:hypothetical protein H0H93_014224 [Arthromyces matolae]
MGVELLTRIFILGADYDYPYAGTPFLLKPDQDYYVTLSSKFQLLVSHVCHHWRQIALRTPSLWSVLHFREPSHILRSREYISRCLPSSYLFDILVDTVSEKDHIPGVTLCREEIQQIFSLICPHVKRWRAFHLKVCDHECKASARQHLSSCGPAPNLETLQLYHFEDYITSQNLYLATYRPPVKVFSNDLPRLKNISLIGVNLPWEHSPYLAHLHTLELALHPENIRPPYEYWENMLRNSPDLQTLSLHYSGPRVANGDMKLVWPTGSERITIRSLEDLSLTDLDPDYLVQLMGRLVLPRLKQLSLDLPDQDFTPFLDLITDANQSVNTLNALSSPSPTCHPHLPFPSLSKLQCLTLTALDASLNSLRNLVRSLRELRALEVHFAAVSDVFVDVLMEELYVEVREDSSDGSSLGLKQSKTEFPTTCPNRFDSLPPSIECIPVLPLLQTFKMSGLSGRQTRELMQFRRKHVGRRTGDGVDVPGVSLWIIKWSQKWKGRDRVLDHLVEQGWTSEDGTRIFVKTYDGDNDDEGDDDDEEVEEEEQVEVDEGIEEPHSHDDISDTDEDEGSNDGFETQGDTT